MWSTLTTQSKLSYLKGLQEDISLLTIQIIDSKRSSVNSGMETVVESNFLLPSNNDLKKLVITIDSVYIDMLNRKIPIIDIYLVAVEGKNYKNQNKMISPYFRDLCELCGETNKFTTAGYDEK